MGLVWKIISSWKLNLRSLTGSEYASEHRLFFLIPTLNISGKLANLFFGNSPSIHIAKRTKYISQRVYLVKDAMAIGDGSLFNFFVANFLSVYFLKTFFGWFFDYITVINNKNTFKSVCTCFSRSLSGIALLAAVCAISKGFNQRYCLLRYA